MKKIRIGSIEIMGYIGIIIWVSVIFLRGYSLSGNIAYLFLLGILPNLGAAWTATMLGKWIVIFMCKQSLTVRMHLLLCAGVFILAFGSEIIHHLFMNSPFDKYDMLITVFAQIFIFFIPILSKDKHFSSYA